MSIYQCPKGFDRFIIAVLILFVLSSCQLHAVSPKQPLAVPTQSNIDLLSPNQESPQINHSIVFLADGRLQLWDHNSGKTETLLDSDVAKYSMNQNGVKLIAAQKDSSDSSVYNLIALDLVDHSSKIVVENIHCLHDYEISPDGQYLWYIADDWVSDEQICKTQLEIQDTEAGTYGLFSYPFEYRLGGTIYIVDIDNDSVSSVGECISINTDNSNISHFVLCTKAIWSPDSQNIIWFDAKGIWVAKLTSREPMMIHALFSENNDHLYSDVKWSPSGKYLMIRGTSLSGQGAKRLILAWQSGKIIEAPYANYYDVGARPYVIWLNDDRLFFTKPMAIAETWKIADDESALIKEISVNLVPASSDYVAAALSQLSKGSLSYVILSPYSENEQYHGLYQTEDLGKEPQQIAALPPIKNYASSVQAIWTNDGSEVIVEYWNYLDGGDSETVFYYIPINSGVLYDLTSILGESAQDVQWLP